MIEADNFLNRLFQGISKKTRVLSGISLGVFLFVLFFQPFSFDPSNFNDYLLFIAGLGVIVFLLMTLVDILVKRFVARIGGSSEERIPAPNLSSLVFILLNSVACAFYLRFVGSVDITFHVMVKVVFISLLPPLILRIYNLFLDLTIQNEQLIRENQQLKRDKYAFNASRSPRTVTFISDNRAGNLNFQVDDIVMFRSADNYVQIIYKDQQTTRKKLLRNTLKNIEQQLEPFTGMIRCHRTCIVNLRYAMSLSRKNNSYWLTLRNYDNQIPVSRQYLIPTKQALA